MGGFSEGAYPTVGVGIEYKMRGSSGRGRDPIIAKLSAGNLEPFDYIELQPPHFIMMPELYGMVSKAPVLIHVSQLSLGSIGIPMDGEFLKLTKRLLVSTGSPWVSEHMSWSRFDGGDTRHFVLPFLGKEVEDTIVKNARRLVRETGVPLLLENAPRKLALKVEGEGPESRFIGNVLRRSGSGLLLDIDSAVESSKALGYDLWSYLRSLPLGKLIEVHVGNPDKQWKILQYLLDRGPVKAVTIDSDFIRGLSRAQTVEVVDRIRPMLKGAVRGRTSVPASVAALTVNLEETEVRLRGGVSFAFKGGKVLAQEPSKGSMLEFPRTLLPVVEHFSDWKPVFTAFLIPEVQTRRPEAFALLGELMRNGMLVTKGGASDATDELWSAWGPALAYYLASRTLSDEPYLTPEESESNLREKAKSNPQPSAFKDYAAHPFYPLPDPLLGIATGRGDAGFLEVLLTRRTSRSFSARPVTKEQLSKLLFFTWGHTGASKNTMGEDVFVRKSSPSGGSLHGAEVYPIIMNVKGVESGVYHYSVRRHGLELLSRDDPRNWIGEACGGQDWISGSSAVFLTTSVLARTAWKYDSARAFRVITHDVGHLSQTFCLVATWLGLGSFTTGALRDEVFEEKIGLEYLEEPVFLLNGAGYPEESERGSERPAQKLATVGKNEGLRLTARRGRVV